MDCQLDRTISQSETIPRRAASVGHFTTTTKTVRNAGSNVLELCGVMWDRKELTSRLSDYRDTQTVKS